MNCKRISVASVFGTFTLVSGFVWAAATYDHESQPGDLLVDVDSGSETFDASRIVQGVTNIVKRGAGSLVVDADLSSYEGSVTIEQGRYKFTTAKSLGSTSSLGGRVRVCENATLESAVAFGTGFVSSQLYDGGPVGRRIEFEGTGCDGNGALQSTAKNYASPFGTNLVMCGNATWGVSEATSSQDAKFAMNGHTLTLMSMGSRREFSIREPRFVGTVGHIDSTNVSLSLGVSRWYEQGKFPNVGGDASNVLTVEKDGMLYFNALRCDFDWTLDMWSGIYCTSSTSGGNRWMGPVVLHGMCDVSAYNFNSYSFNASGPVSGDGGFYLHGHPLGEDPAQPTIRNNPHLELKNSGNSFTGGFCGQYGTLHLYADGALPANGGMLAMTNGTVRFETNGWFALPSATFDGTGVVYGACGEWKDRLTKTGTGTLEYASHIGAPCLEMKGGKIVLPSHNSNMAGLNCGWKLYDKPWSWSLYTKFLSDSVCYTNETRLTPGHYYQNATIGAQEWQNGWHTNMYLTYTGYLWNRSGVTQTWAIAYHNLDNSRLKIDGATVIDTKDAYVTFAQVVLSPGPHAFELRTVTNGDKWCGPRGAADLEKHSPSLNWENNLGLVYNTTGVISSNATDYVKFVDPGDGSLFTRARPGETVEFDGHAVGFVPTFPTVDAEPGTVIAFDDAVDYSVENVKGWTAFSNCNLRITANWMVGSRSIPGNEMTVEGALTFAEGSKLVINEPDARVPHGQKHFCVCTADEGIVGMPELEASERWTISKSADGKSLWLDRRPNGAVLIVR